MQIITVNPCLRNVFSFHERLFPSNLVNSNSFFDYIKILIPLIAGSICLLFGTLILTGVITTLPICSAGYFLSLGITLAISGIGLCMAFRRPIFSIKQSENAVLCITCY
ncbi:hypothetical protein [Chlamydia sp.]|uniref:hypothetical protein n=1 Tax=Chlamydia sp. TaxID=35827 RepID=UPI0025B7EFAC|nr:hypothetical protein [Chlamydia sp.]MBQ8498368.1 hypothetical protein [Chlamydia sp.]